MRIISDFVDYYDCIMKYGIDKSVVYVRKSEVIETENDAFKKENKSIDDIVSSFHNNGNRIRLRKIKDKDKNKKTFKDYYNNDNTICFRFFIIVCDTCYTGIEYNGIYFYNEETFNGHICKLGLEIDNSFIWLFGSKHVNYFNTIKIGYDFSIKYKSPIFAYAFGANDINFKHSLVKDSYLRKYQFYKVQEPQVIFQNIQQFISGILADHADKSDLIEISDDLKIQSHGFDKQSFRKRKQE